MDYQQWRNQQQSDQPSAKVTKLQTLDQQQHQHSRDSALTLFAPEPEPEPNSDKATITTPALSAFPDSAPTTFAEMGGFFSLAQWQELELQALIYKYMLAGASVPLELVLPLKRSLFASSPYYHHPQQYHHFQPAVVQTGYWGRSAIDPEPGRCRRTDGKKWRCSREVVAGHKYCERHVHRGRNRSRKHVEIPTPAGSSSGFKATLPSPLVTMTTRENRFNATAVPNPTLDILPLNQRPPDGKTTGDGSLPTQSYNHNFNLNPLELEGERRDGQVLRRFFDDWPRPEQESTTTSSRNSDTSPGSTTKLSISIPKNPSSDFSLKLSTGSGGDTPGLSSKKDAGDGQVQPAPANWSGWGSQREASVGGPLAEALLSSTSTPSPTSILPKPNISVSETSSTST